MAAWYLDVGVFVTPMLKNRSPAVQEECLKWLDRTRKGEIQAFTSYLTWDEVTWVIGKQRPGATYDAGRAQAAGDALLQLPNLTFVDVGQAVVGKAARMLSLGVRPRDCVHAATALLYAAGNLVTLDSSFAKASHSDLKVVHIV